MKKKYIAPQMIAVEIGRTQLLTGSGRDKMKVTVDGQTQVDIVYGGEDEEGDLDPD